MIGLRLLWTLEYARLTSSRGRSWLDTLAIFGFTVATTIMLVLAGAISLFWNRAEAPSEELLSELSSVSDGSSAVTSHMLSVFFDSYQSVTALAFFIVILPALSLGASAAAVVARSRNQVLGRLRLLGLGRFHAYLMVLTVVLAQMILGLVAGTLVYFTSFYLWQLLEFQGALVSATEVMITWSVWLDTALLLTAVTVLATFSAFNASRIWRASKGVGAPFRLLSLPALLISGLLVGLGALIELGSSNTTFTGELALPVAALAVFVGFVMPAGFYLLGRFLATRARTDLVLAGGWLQTNARAAALTVFPAALTMFLALTLGAQPHDFISVISEDSGTPIAASAVPDHLAYLLQRDIVVGLLLVCVGVIVVSIVSASLEQATVIINRHTQSEMLLMLGVDSDFLTRARLWQILVPHLVGLGLGVLLAAALVLPHESLTKLPLEVPFLVAAVFAATFVVALVANRWLAPLQCRVVRPDLRQVADSLPQ